MTELREIHRAPLFDLCHRFAGTIRCLSIYGSRHCRISRQRCRRGPARYREPAHGAARSSCLIIPTSRRGYCLRSLPTEALLHFLYSLVDRELGNPRALPRRPGHDGVYELYKALLGRPVRGWSHRRAPPRGWGTSVHDTIFAPEPMHDSRGSGAPDPAPRRKSVSPEEPDGVELLLL